MSTIFYKFFLRAQFFVKVICCGKFFPAISLPKAAKRYRTQKRARRRCCPTTHTGETTKAVAALARHPSQDRPRLKSSRSDKRPPHRAYHKNNRSIKNAARRAKRAAARRRGRKKLTVSRKNGRAAILRRARMRQSLRVQKSSLFRKMLPPHIPAVRTSLYTAPAPYTSYLAACKNPLHIPLPPPANCGMPRRARDLCSAHKPSRHTETPSADFCLRRGSVFQKIYRRRKPVLPYTSSMMTCSAASPRRLPRDTMRV